MTESITIRPAASSDAETVASFNAALAKETEDLHLDPETLRAGVARALDDESTGLYFVAVDGKRAVGQCMVTYEWSDWRNGWLWWFQSVYVHPEYRRNGIFAALYRHVETLAKQTPDVCGLRLYVEENNERAMQTYKRLGMVPSGHVVFEKDWSDH